MNLVVVGTSFRTAPVDLIERLSRPVAPDALAELLQGTHVTEAVLVSTCNRVEVYAAVPAFHPGLAQLVEVMSGWAGLTPDELGEYLHVHHGPDAVRHVFRVAAGLDSMVAGEAQILGQVRDAYQQATEVDAAGRVLHELLQQALRVGKRVHAETGIDAAPRNMVSAALDLAAPAAVAADQTTTADHAARWLVIGAGAMGALAVAELTRRGLGPIAVINRGEERAGRLAAGYGAEHHHFSALPVLLADTDYVISATAAPDPVLTVDLVTAATAGRERPLTIIDLAIPRDVAPGVARLSGVTVLDVERIGTARATVGQGTHDELDEVERIVAGEVEAYLGWLRGAEAAPTVAALRTRADELVSAELRRLAQRRPELTDAQRADVSHTVHRIVQRLLHQPTVSVRRLAGQPGGEAYMRLLRELFDLDTQVETVAQIPDLAAPVAAPAAGPASPVDLAGPGSDAGIEASTGTARLPRTETGGEAA